MRGTDGRIWHAWQPAVGGALSGFQLLHDLGPQRPILDLSGRPTVWNQSNGAIAVACVESDREAFVIARTDDAPYWTDYALAGSDVASEIAAAAGGGTSGLFALGPARDLRVLLRRP